MLKKQGYKKIFYSEIDCKKYSKDSPEYGALISYALKKAKCMLLVCSNKAYLDTPWVKNEYTRFRRKLEANELDESQIIIVDKGDTRDKVVELPGRKGIQNINRSSISGAGVDKEEKSKWLKDLADKIISMVDVANEYIPRNYKYCPNCKKVRVSGVYCSECRYRLFDSNDFLNLEKQKLKKELEEKSNALEKKSNEVKAYIQQAENSKKNEEKAKEELEKVINEKGETQKHLEDKLAESREETKRLKQGIASEKGEFSDIEKYIRGSASDSYEIKMWRRDANKGDAQAQFKLGEHYKVTKNRQFIGTNKRLTKT